MTLEFTGTMLCSAGVSYFHVYPNGDVYRCLADYNARRPPMFNLKRDGWKGDVNPTVCDHERCYNACDLDWTTKWQVDAQGRLEKTFEGQRKDVEKAVSLHLCSQRLESPQRRMAYFIWSPTLACNYTCAYCGCAAGEKRLNQFPSSQPELTVDEWIDVWSDILERFEYGVLSITGGEPLLSEATIPVLGMVTQKFACYMTSNISRNIMEFARGRIRAGGAPEVVEGFGEVPIGLAGINCSLHPTSKGFNWELFKGSILLLRNAGFHVSVNYVGYPLQLYLAPEYKAWCEQNQIEFTLSSWQGVDNDGTISRYLPRADLLRRARAVAPQEGERAGVHGLQLRRDARQPDHARADDRHPDADGSHPQPVSHRVAGRQRTGPMARRWLYHPRRAAQGMGARVVYQPAGQRGAAERRTGVRAADRHPRPAGRQLRGVARHADGPRKLDGPSRGGSGVGLLRIEAFRYEITVDADAVTLSPGGTAVLSGALRNTCGKPWPVGTGGEPLQLGARLFRQSAKNEAVREFRASLERLPETAEDAVAFRMVFDPGELERGDYELSIDVLKEYQFWLAEKGTGPRIIPVVIT